MSQCKPEQPKRLAEKLLLLRRKGEFTQDAMLEALIKKAPKGTILRRGYISRYESGTRIPSLFVLLAYSRLGKTSIDMLVDDDVDIL